MRRYKFHFEYTKEFIIVPEKMIEQFLAEKKAADKIYIPKEDIFPSGYMEYLRRVLNVNQHHPVFSYEYINEYPICETGILTILMKQLKTLKVDEKDCFKEIRSEMHGQEVVGIILEYSSAFLALR